MQPDASRTARPGTDILGDAEAPARIRRGWVTMDALILANRGAAFALGALWAVRPNQCPETR